MTKSMSPLHVAVGVVRNNKGETLISLRDKKAHQGDLWEFPGGKVQPGEAVTDALARELKEELDITVHHASPLIKINHCYPDLAVLLDVWTIDKYSGVARPNEGQPLRWMDPQALDTIEFPEANYPIRTAVRLPEYYAILDDQSKNLRAELDRILSKGVKLVQLRLKGMSTSEADAFLSGVCPILKSHNVSVLLNSEVKVSHCFPVDGIHLTSQDLRGLKTRPANIDWVAASCHNYHELKLAENLGLDFVVLAPVLPTRTHPNSPAIGWENFAELVSQVNIPVYALGGMSLSDAAVSRRLGGQGVSGISMFLDDGEID